MVGVAQQSYSYLRPSALVDDGRGRALHLETSGGSTPAGLAEHPRFFAGFLAEPEQGAKGLLSVAAVARARYYVPMTSQRLQEILDPVVTSNGDRLRFESFSGCCGVYARLDVLSGGLDGDLMDRGTTNVDVNLPLRDALARVGGGEPLHLAVGADDVTVTTLDDSVVERKVALPRRWLRGFAEVQASASTMDLRAEIDAVEARRFLRSLPKGSNRGALWAVPAGRSLRVTTRPVPGAVCLAGPERLENLLPLLRFATHLRVYGPVVGPGGPPVPSVWELVLRDARLSLTLSPDLSRGFSGEGGVLDALAADSTSDDADLVSAVLAWEPRVEVDLIAERSGLAADRVRRALAQLGTAGQVGYDVAEAAYFHRELPYDASAVEGMNPRLRNARALVDSGAVTVDGDLVVVQVDDHVQHVRLSPDGATCTCQWWAKYAGSRGPCKHVLAAQIVAGERDGAVPSERTQERLP
ncbi:MAG TPA: SWIM zinc finger family protein [Actinomycetes bacterium]